MAGKSMKRVRVAAAILAGVGAVLGSAPKVSAQVPVYAESPADALARSVRILATSPKDFRALVAAGKASLDLGDAQSAAGFYARAAEVNSNNPAAQAGMGAALVASGDPQASLSYFARAQQLGADVSTFACDRGLAYDLLGQQEQAQADYRAAMLGSDRDEATRRLALSQAISGNKPAALATLQPLLQRRDLAATRVRSLVLALGGEIGEAKAALDWMMPGASTRMEPFFRRLPQLSSAQKAAAVHLGVFPGASGSAAPGEGLASIEEMLRQPNPATIAAAPAVVPQGQPVPQRPPAAIAMATVTTPTPVRASSGSESEIATKRVLSASGNRKIWLQLASGANPDMLPAEFRKIRSRSPDLFEDISGYVAQDGAKARLVIGPFRSREDANLFEEALSGERISAISWISAPGQPMRKLDE
jgi:tetratricopeptide (TPR) repeat protein